MRSFKILASLAAILLASCAAGGSPAMLSGEQKSVLRLDGITAESQSLVTIPKDAMDRMVQQIRAEIQAQSPAVFSAPAPGTQVMTMKLVFTAYDGADLGSRYVKNGGGIVHINADVLFVDAHGRIAAQTPVVAQFGASGISGLSTDIRNVEEDFEREVAALVR